MRERAEFQAKLRSAPVPSSGDAPAPRTEEPLPKAFRIGYDDLVEHGFSEGCPQCDHSLADGRRRDGLNHFALCRTRVETAMQATETGAVIDYRDWQIPLGRRFRALKLEQWVGLGTLPRCAYQ